MCSRIFPTTYYALKNDNLIIKMSHFMSGLFVGGAGCMLCLFLFRLHLMSPWCSFMCLYDDILNLSLLWLLFFNWHTCIL